MKVLDFNNSKKKPREIEQVLPWPPSDGLLKEMEQGLITKATFALELALKGPSKSQDEVMRELENKRKL